MKKHQEGVVLKNLKNYLQQFYAEWAVKKQVKTYKYFLLNVIFHDYLSTALFFCIVLDNHKDNKQKKINIK